jgi:hypothetical protein
MGKDQQLGAGSTGTVVLQPIVQVVFLPLQQQVVVPAQAEPAVLPLGAQVFGVHVLLHHVVRGAQTTCSRREKPGDQRVRKESEKETEKENQKKKTRKRKPAKETRKRKPAKKVSTGTRHR